MAVVVVCATSWRPCVRAELSDLSDAERMEALASAGLDAAAAEDVSTFLSVLPTVHGAFQAACHDYGHAVMGHGNGL